MPPLSPRRPLFRLTAYCLANSNRYSPLRCKSHTSPPAVILNLALRLVQIVVPVLVVTFDLYVLVLTLKKTYQTAKEMRVLGFESRSLTGLLMRDGTGIYSLVLLREICS